MKLIHSIVLGGLLCIEAVPTWQAYGDESSLFKEICAVCHGLGGKGDGPSASGLHPKPADFTDCKAISADSDETLFKIIKEGGQSVGRSTVMPAWKDSLRDEQIRALVKYIRSLCKK